MDTMEALIRICLASAYVDGALSPTEIEGIEKLAHNVGAFPALRRILAETSELRHRWQSMDEMLTWLEPALLTIERSSQEVRFMASLMIERVIGIDDEFDQDEQTLARRLKARIVPESPPRVRSPSID